MVQRAPRTRAAVALCAVVCCLACGGTAQVLGKSDASTGPGDAGNADGGASSSSGSSSGGTVGSCNGSTCAMGCCDSLGVCNESHADTECGLSGTACADCTKASATCVAGECLGPGDAGHAFACGGASCDPMNQDCCITSGMQACIPKGQCQGATFLCLGPASCPAAYACCLSQPAHGQPIAACGDSCGANGSLYVCTSNADCPMGLTTCTFGGFGPGVGFCK